MHFMKHTRSYLRSQKIVQKRRKRVLRRAVLWVSGLGIGIGALSGISHLDAITIQTIEVKGNQVVPSQHISTKVEEMLKNSEGVLLSRRNILLYSSGKIEKDLMSMYPRFSQVVVHAKSPTKIEVAVSERKPTSLWCKDPFDQIQEPVSNSTVVQESSSTVGQCYFIDAQGFIFSLAPNFQGNSYLKFYGGDVGAQPIGSALMSSSTYNQLVNLADTLEKKNLSIDYITVKNSETFHVKLQENGEVYFSTVRSLEESLNNFLAALTSEVFVAKQGGATSSVEMAASKLKKFEYVDVRFGNKVFFKMKGLPFESSAASSSQ